MSFTDVCPRQTFHSCLGNAYLKEIMFAKCCDFKSITLMFLGLLLLAIAGCYSAPRMAYQTPAPQSYPTASVQIDSQRRDTPLPNVKLTPKVQVTAPNTPFLQPTPERVFTPSIAALSRDLLFVAKKGSYLAVYGVDRDGSNLTLWQDNFKSLTALSFSESGSAIAILGTHGSDIQSIYVDRTDASTGGFSVAVLMTVTSPLVWSPQGNAIAFSADNGQSESVYAIDLATKHLTQLIEDPSLLARNPRWSPDGKWIAFQSQSTKYPGCFEGCSSKIVLMNTQSGAMEQVTASLNSDVYDLRGECDVSWSPDSTEFVFQEDCLITDGPHQLFIFNVRTHKVRPLLPDETNIQNEIGDDAPHWLSDNTIFFFSDRNDLSDWLMVKPSGENLRRVAKLPQPFRLNYFDFSRDGAWVTWTDQNNELWVGNTTTEQVTDLHVMACEVKFSPSSLSIAYTTWCFPHEGEYGLWTIDRDTKSVVNVAPSLKLPRLPTPWSWNPSKSQ